MKPTSKTLSWAFVIILLAVGIFTGLGVILMHKQPLVLQGQAEATEIRISGKLPGRIDTFFVQEGDWVHRGDTLVVINSPEVHAKYQQVNALEQVAVQQNKKIDAGTRRQIVATALQLWNKTKSDLTLAQTTYNRILTLYKDSVITSQRKDEVEAMYKAAVAAERAAYEQYQMAVDGAQKEDKASAASMVDAARSTVDEVSALLVDARLTAPENVELLPGKTDASKALIVGLRSWDEGMQERQRKLGIKGLSPQEVANDRTKIMEWLKSTGVSKVVIHFDMDVLDPAEIIAAVGVEPNGMKIEEVVRIINDISSEYDLVGLTVAEPMPRVAIKLRNMLNQLPLLKD